MFFVCVYVCCEIHTCVNAKYVYVKQSISCPSNHISSARGNDSNNTHTKQHEQPVFGSDSEEKNIHTHVYMVLVRLIGTFSGAKSSPPTPKKNTNHHLQPAHSFHSSIRSFRNFRKQQRVAEYATHRANMVESYFYVFAVSITESACVRLTNRVNE